MLQRLGLFKNRQNFWEAAWGRWRRELLIAGATLCVVLLLVVGAQWLFAPSAPVRSTTPDSAPDADQAGSPSNNSR
jgi:hypothetical protein